jgi:hypothetical protein
MSDWLQFEFWTELAKAEPSLSHLDDVGREISESIQSAESAYVSALKIAPDSLVMLQKYSRFLLEVTLTLTCAHCPCPFPRVLVPAAARVNAASFRVCASQVANNRMRAMQVATQAMSIEESMARAETATAVFALDAIVRTVARSHTLAPSTSPS